MRRWQELHQDNWSTCFKSNVEITVEFGNEPAGAGSKCESRSFRSVRSPDASTAASEFKHLLSCLFTSSKKKKPLQKPSREEIKSYFCSNLTENRQKWRRRHCRTRRRSGRHVGQRCVWSEETSLKFNKLTERCFDLRTSNIWAPLICKPFL